MEIAGYFKESLKKKLKQMRRPQSQRKKSGRKKFHIEKRRKRRGLFGPFY